MSVRIFSAAIQGIDAQPVEVEVDSAPGLHALVIVGLPDKAVQESRDRITAALRNSGFLPPSSVHKKIIVNLAPADLKKEGPSYDLPIALGYLLETGQVKFDPSKRLFAGELSLDGSLKHTSGILSRALLAQKLGFSELFIPAANAAEAAVVERPHIIGATCIRDVIAHLDGTGKIFPHKNRGHRGDAVYADASFFFIQGQEAAKRALVITAAGGHNMLLCGPPGTGKTILAKALPELLPPLSPDEALEVAKIYSAVGLLDTHPFSLKRPYRSPHHTASAPALIGGGTWPKPGEISLAHRGVLFLDELPEFHRNVLESLRQPLEDGVVTVSRAAGSLLLPAKFTLIAAMNPCPCGNFGNEKNPCICHPGSILRYRKKISGPLLDRIDIQVIVPRETIHSPDRRPQNAENLNAVREHIKTSRDIQEKRLKPYGIFTNAEISFKHVDKLCILDSAAEKLLMNAVNTKYLSLRTYHKVKKLGRTIADLAQSPLIQEQHIAEAIGLRVNDKLLFDVA